MNKQYFEGVRESTREALNTLELELKENKVDEMKVNLVLQNQDYLSPQEKEKLSKLLPLINEIENSSKQTDSKALVSQKENKILNFFKNLKDKISNLFNSKNKSVKTDAKAQSVMDYLDQIQASSEELQHPESKLDQYKVSKEAIEQAKKEEEARNYKQETIVISDLHGRIDNWEFIKTALEKNKGLSVIILGDAMDRGNYGPEILMEIKEYSDQGRALYLPGNHDVFAYNYLKTKNVPGQEKIFNEANQLLNLNGGKVTIDKFNNFNNVMLNELNSGRIKKPVTLEELTDWLGKQPIQYKSIEGNKYAMAHAIFDEELYQYNKNFSMEDALNLEQLKNSGRNFSRQNQKILDKFNNCMWFRDKGVGENGVKYAETSWPKGYCVVAGHTRQKEVNANIAEGNPYHAIVYVDCGKGYLEGFNLTTNQEVKFTIQEKEELNRNS